MHPQAKVFEKFLFLNEIRATGGWKMDVSIRAHSLLCFKFSGAGLIPVAIRDEKLMEQRKKKEKKKKKKSQVIRITPDVQIFLNNCGTIVNEDRNETN